MGGDDELIGRKSVNTWGSLGPGSLGWCRLQWEPGWDCLFPLPAAASLRGGKNTHTRVKVQPEFWRLLQSSSGGAPALRRCSSQGLVKQQGWLSLPVAGDRQPKGRTPGTLGAVDAPVDGGLMLLWGLLVG